MMANINFLQRKTKNSPAFKLIQAHVQQRQSHLTNTIYNQMKQQAENMHNQKTVDHDFQTDIEKKMAHQPGTVMAKTFSRSKFKQEEDRKRKLLKYRCLSPKRSYQLETKASVGRKGRWMSSILTEENRQPRRTKTANSRPSTANPLRSTQLSYQQKKASLRSSAKKMGQPQNGHYSNKLSRSLSKLSDEYYSTIQQQPECSTLDILNQAMCQIRKQSKKFEQSLVKTQQRFQKITQVHDKMDKHFGSLLLDAKEFPQFEFDDYSQMTKVDRYVYSSNYILENLLSKNDQEVQEWIEREKHKQLRRRGAAIVHLTKHIVVARSVPKLTTEQKNSLSMQKDAKMRKLLQTPEQQINRLRVQRDMTLANITSPARKGKSPTKQAASMSMTEYGRNVKQIKEYEKRKFMTKTAYQPKRGNNLSLIVK